MLNFLKDKYLGKNTPSNLDRAAERPIFLAAPHLWAKRLNVEANKRGSPSLYSCTLTHKRESRII
jgi:hypothetical protein